MTVPLVLVTGFLGAGKTTLINRLLARRRERGATGKLGLIVNELGEIDIDGALLAGAGESEAPRRIELPGGCVCCVLGDELGATLIDLVDGTPRLESIVLETTGVAEPLPIAWAIAREPVCERVRLAAVVTLVDATNFSASRAVSASVDSQVAYADVLLLTKAELLGDRSDDIARLESVVRSIAPRALLRRGTADEHAAWLETLLADPALPGLPDVRNHFAAERPTHSPDGEVGHVHTDDCRHLDSAAHGIDSVWTTVPRAVDLEELEDQLAELPANYVRIKGIVQAIDPTSGDATRWFAVHRVGPRVSSEPIAPQELEQGRIVALGPAVTRADLDRCVAIAAG